MVLTRGGVNGWAAVVLAATMAAGVQAQAPLPGIEVQPRVQAPQPKTSLDLGALVTSPDAMPNGGIEDPVWSLQPQPGRRLIQVPIHVEPLDEQAELAQPPIELRGGRFIGWRIDPDDYATQQGPDGRAFDPTMPTADSRNLGAFFGLRGGDPAMYPGQPGMPPGAMQPGGFNPAAAMLGGTLPPGAPLLTRELIVHPDATITWDLERVIPGATVRDAQQGYALKLRPDLIAALEPQRPQFSAGGDPIQARQQRREQEMRFRQEVQAFRQLREAVRDLPERFELPLPDRVWAVYEVTNNLPQLSFTGEAPLPWNIGLQDLQTLRSTTGAGRGGPGSEAYAAAAVFENMARDNHPLTHRAIAHALHDANLIGQAQVNDSLYQVLRAVVTGPDDTARQIVVEDLAATIPPTSATAALLREASGHMSPQMQLAALRGLLQGDPNDRQQLRDMIDNANRTIADPNGPDAGLVLQAIAEGVSVDDLGNAGPAVGFGNTASGVAGPMFITGIEFDSLPDDRRDQAIAYVVRAAGRYPLAAAWLNHRLLGSNNQGTVRRTLELLSRATGATGVLQPVGEALTALVFGHADGQGGTPTLDLTLLQPIPLDSTGHSIFRGINSGDPKMRELAWQSLPNFTVTPADERRRAPDASAATEEIVAQLLVAGLSQRPTPPALVRFLARQRLSPRATSGLIEVMLYGEGQATRSAARALVGSGRDLMPALQTLDPASRGELAGQLYHHVRGHAPLATGLFAAPEAETALQAFTQSLAAGDLPDPVTIAEQFGGEQALLGLAASSDPRVAAGAVAGLVALAGGDELAAQELAQRLQSSGNRTPAAIASAWATAKKDIFARRLADAAGPYRVQVRLFDAGAGGMAPGMPPGYYDEFGGYGEYGDPAAYGPLPQAPTQTPREVIPIGVVDLNVDGQAVFLGNQTVNLGLSSERLALQLNGPDLRNFQVDQLAQVPLDRLMAPILLTPQPDGAWRGSGALPDGATVEVVLEPIEQ